MLHAFGNIPHLFSSPTGNTGSCRLVQMFSCTKDIVGKKDLTQTGIAINARLVTSQPPLAAASMCCQAVSGKGIHET